MFDDIQPNQQPSSPLKDGQIPPANHTNQPISPSAKEPLSDVPTIPVGGQQSPPEVDQPVAKDAEDIFAEVDKTDGDYSSQPPGSNLAANLNRRGQAGAEDTEMPGLAGAKKSKSKIILIILIVLLVAVGAAWFVYAYLIAPKMDNIPTETSNNGADLPTATNNTVSNQNENVNINTNVVVEIIKPPVDTDGDGLTDEDEVKFGTNPKLMDTDLDGLTDQEEIIKYKTDPRNADSDGDGYSDGDEVKNGYNPLGGGKLLDKVELP